MLAGVIQRRGRAGAADGLDSKVCVGLAPVRAERFTRCASVCEHGRPRHPLTRSGIRVVEPYVFETGPAVAADFVAVHPRLDANVEFGPCEQA